MMQFFISFIPFSDNTPSGGLVENRYVDITKSNIKMLG